MLCQGIPTWEQPKMLARPNEKDLFMDVQNRFAFIADSTRLRLFQRGVEVRGSEQSVVGGNQVHRFCKASFKRQPFYQANGGRRPQSGRACCGCCPSCGQPTVSGKQETWERMTRLATCGRGLQGWKRGNSLCIKWLKPACQTTQMW